MESRSSCHDVRDFSFPHLRGEECIFISPKHLTNENDIKFGSRYWTTEQLQKEHDFRFEFHVCMYICVCVYTYIYTYIYI